ncbi:hypothetical protein, partial [Massilia sp. ST3]|uniref:hypothetical protein n=1 Tax=Massilia sp. ST3 TaxID=2824903 RepID=UPI001B814DA7
APPNRGWGGGGAGGGGGAPPPPRRHLYVADQVGQVWRIHVASREDEVPGDGDGDGDDGRREPALFLDVSQLLVPLGLGPISAPCRPAWRRTARAC